MMLFDAHDLPSVFVTDKEFACINALRQVFPEAHRMLCTFHISKNVNQHCKKLFNNEFAWTLFLRDWSNYMMAIMKEDFFARWKDLNEDWKEFPKALDYLAKNWYV